MCMLKGAIFFEADQQLRTIEPTSALIESMERRFPQKPKRMIIFEFGFVFIQPTSELGAAWFQR